MLLPVLFLIFLFGMLTHPALGHTYASLGLRLWAEHMIPSLFPFMILSDLMIRTGKVNILASFFHPLMGKLFQASPNACYCILVGFLCGFPMGARSVAECYRQGQITKKEAEWLLCFCNQIGPVYFAGVVLPILGLKSHRCLYWLGMYAIPIFYGMILRKTIYRNFHQSRPEPSKGSAASDARAFGPALDESIKSAVRSILNLGGYIVFFCVCNFLPEFLLGKPCPVLGLLFEINSGLLAMQDKSPVISLTFLCFGGLSCIAQTYNSLQETDLTEFIGLYTFHKLILSLIIFLYYFLLRLFLVIR